MPDPLGGRIELLPLAQLHLDPKNPRLPKGVQASSETEMLRYIEANYQPIVIGRSIALHGYFVSEPLIVIKPRKSDGYIVVEGNRRLVALKLLSDAETRDLVSTKEWDELAQQARLPKDGIPVVIAKNRAEIAPIIGYRHIAGIQEWEPYPKSRYITEMIDEGEQTFADVAELVGEPEATIRRYYRNYSIVEQAREQFSLDTQRVEENFGIFDRAMTGGVRSYIGAPIPSATSERTFPLPKNADTIERVAEVFRWIYGTDQADSVISDSRDLSRLSRVLQEPEGAEALRRTNDLTEAYEAAKGGRSRLIDRISTAETQLRAALQDIDAYADDDQILVLLAACRDALEHLVGRTDA